MVLSQEGYKEVEIVTRAVYGSGRGKYSHIVEVEVAGTREMPGEVLSTYVTNHVIKSTKVLPGGEHSKKVRVEGCYDLHVWFCGQNDTYTNKYTMDFAEEIEVSGDGGEFSNEEARAHIVEEAKCCQAGLMNRGGTGMLKAEISQVLGCEIYGIGKLKVLTAGTDRHGSSVQLPGKGEWVKKGHDDDDDD